MRTRKQLPLLTDNAKVVLQSRYLRNESPAQMFERVAEAISAEEGRAKRKWSERFYEMMSSLRFLPNSPTLMNAGRPLGQLSACFVLPIEDSLVSIFDALKAAALIHQSGGGTGFAFSRLRPEGSEVQSTKGVASGPVSFMRIFDTSTETIKQGGTRRGANMAVLKVNHPDILKFIDCKMDMKSITNFNISVGITDDFMKSVERNADYFLIDPRTNKKAGKLNAKSVFDRLVHAAWTCGDPGLVFLDRVNEANPTPQVGEMESTNPCGEQPLLPYESCNLGSLNVAAYLRGTEFDWALYKQDIWNAVRFLDNVIDVNHFPIPQCQEITLRNRKIGLGIMGFADLLLLQGISYSSELARERGGQLMNFLDFEAKRASAALAKERGAFPNWKGSLWHAHKFPKLRNATVSTIAPTGTISIIAGVSGGIEPIYSARSSRNVLDGKRLTEIHPSVKRILTHKRVAKLELLGETEIAGILGEAWSPSHEVTVENHIKMQAIFQKYSDSGVSKTVNLSSHATERDVAEAYTLAYSLRCKGVTIYRDRSRPTQVLEHCPAC